MGSSPTQARETPQRQKHFSTREDGYDQFVDGAVDRCQQVGAVAKQPWAAVAKAICLTLNNLILQVGRILSTRKGSVVSRLSHTCEPREPKTTQKENDMRIVTYILMVLCALLMVLCYSLCVIASEADRRADRMYRKWKEEHNDRT